MKRNIGIVTTWFERGASYVSKAYVEALQNNNHNVFVYARGGEKFARSDSEWNKDYVTWGQRLSGTNVNKRNFYKWINENKLDIIFFNEQHEFSIVAKLKKDFPNIKIGSYIDYYKEDTIEFYNIYDFIICNTKRHCEAFENHHQKYYIPWGTNIELFKPQNKNCNNYDKVVFFHSAGMSIRKGTDLLITAFIKGKLYTKSKLIIHTQTDIKKISGYDKDELEEYGIEIIEKTVTAPGLYHLGDVYVYPTRLEGLGLTIFEALSCGLPVIVTNNAPMNEIVNDKVGKLINVKRFYCRSDGYYWPLSHCNVDDLVKKMNYYIENFDIIDNLKANARKYAEDKLDWEKQYERVNQAFEESLIKEFDEELYNKIINKEKRERISHLKKGVSLNNSMGYFIKKVLDSTRNK